MTTSKPSSLPSVLLGIADPLSVSPIERPFDAAMTPPGSKSLANRAVAIAGLADGTCELQGVPQSSDDAEALLTALGQLGCRVDRSSQNDGCIRIDGCGGAWPISEQTQQLDLRGAGTAVRFTTALASLASRGGAIAIDGEPRMRLRPIGELTAALRSIGVRIEHLGEDGFPPLRIYGVDDAASIGSEVRFARTASSQYVSAMLLLAPFLPKGLTLCFDAPLTSEPYVDMTVGLLRDLGVGVVKEGSSIRVDPLPRSADGTRGLLPAFQYTIEPDASGASYFWAAAAIVPGARSMVPHLTMESSQGDVVLVDALERMGAHVERSADGIAVQGTETLRGISIDMGDMPDVAMTLASVCCFADGVSELRGLRTLRVKECDRIDAMATELPKIGVRITPFAYGSGESADEGIRIEPPVGGIDCAAGVPRVDFGTYNDHRMAMSLALLGLRRPNVWICDPACVRKTYAAFWRDLKTLYAG